MSKLMALIFLSAVLPLSLTGQDCESYFPQKEGTELELRTFNAKGKPEGTTRQKLVLKEVVDGVQVFKVQQTFNDEKGKKQLDNELTFRCDGDKFLIDMQSFIDQQQLEVYRDMEIEMTVKEIYIPSRPSVGQELEDGSIEMKIQNGPVTMVLRADISNRKIEALEEITTAAGTFKCLKISQDVEAKFAFVKARTKNVAWYAKEVGIVRNETYNQGGKLLNYQELVGIRE